MKPAFTRELARFGLRPASKPQRDVSLSGVVAVADREGKGFVYVKFSEALVEAVGKVLPQGVGPESPGFLKVVHLHATDRWRVFAYYVDLSKGALLWESSVKPSWIKHIRRGENGSK